MRVTLFGRRLLGLAGFAVILFVLSALTARPLIWRGPSLAVNTAVAPVEITLAAVGRAMTATWRSVVSLFEVRAQNARLRAEVTQLRAEVQGYPELRAEDAQANALIGLQAAAAASGYGQGIAARVIGRSADNWFDSLVIDRGSRDGVRAGMVAVTPGGLVGRVEPGVGPISARIMLLTNPDFGVGVVVQRSASRAEGVATGQIGSERLQVTFFASNADVRTGDVLLTSGLSTSGSGPAFPPGLQVGVVTSVSAGGFGLVRQAVVVPSARLDALEQVLLLPAAGAGG